MDGLGGALAVGDGFDGQIAATEHAVTASPDLGGGGAAIGVNDDALLMTMAEALSKLGCDRGLVVRGEDGMDEISPCSATKAVEVNGDSLKERRFEPGDFGLTPLAESALVAGSNASENARILRHALEDADSPQAQALIPNAAAALYLADVAPDLPTGARLAKESIASGAAARKLSDLIEVTQAL